MTVPPDDFHYLIEYIDTAGHSRPLRWVRSTTQALEFVRTYNPEDREDFATLLIWAAMDDGTLSLIGGTGD